MSKITEIQTAKIFAMYIGCEIISPHPNEDGEELNGYLTGIHGELEAEVQYIENGDVWEHPGYHDYKNTKLLLTPLSSITDEDAIEICKIDYDIFRNTGYSFKVGKKLKNEKVVFCIKSDSENEIIPIKLYSVSSLAAQYLISKGYAVPIWLGVDHPLNGKTPIELGIAIDKTLK